MDETRRLITQPFRPSGRGLVFSRRRNCHGQRAYPGKGPKLKPSKYAPEFVFKRITKGFRGMPSWESMYDEKQRMSITAWVMSRDFEN